MTNDEPCEVGMTAPTESKVKLSGPAALVGAIPTMLGFAPKDGDLVIAAFKGNRLGFCMRIDHDELPVAQLSVTLAERARHAGEGRIDGAFVLLYGDAEF